MGISKAMMEKLMVAKARLSRPGGTILCGTRYGNVMASRGSVIPLFIQQVKDGQPLTVTDPHMTRFMMSIDDAVDLVLFAYRARQARRHLRPEGAGRDDRDAGAGRQAAVRCAESRSA